MKHLMIGAIRFYQKYISPIISPMGSCIYKPTCSQYSIEAYTKYGFFKGTYLTAKRILRCHPLREGGYDPLE